jgi:hypothetical protein
MSVGIDTSAEKGKCDISRGNLNPFFQADVAFDGVLQDGVPAHGIVDFGPGVRAFDEMRDAYEEVDGIS